MSSCIRLVALVEVALVDEYVVLVRQSNDVMLAVRLWIIRARDEVHRCLHGRARMIS